MKILVAGATGAVGKRLVPQLVDAGHTVVGTTRDPAKVAVLRDRGAEATVVDGLDGNAIHEAVRSAEPEVIVNQMTSLASMGSNMGKFDLYFAATNQLRTEGTAHLLAAARVVGTRRFVTQSYGSWNNLRDGVSAATEIDPLDPNPVKGSVKTARAIVEQEAMMAEANDIETVVLRYGNFYGPGLPSTGTFGTVQRHRSGTRLTTNQRRQGPDDGTDDRDLAPPESGRLGTGQQAWHPDRYSTTWMGNAARANARSPPARQLYLSRESDTRIEAVSSRPRPMRRTR